MKKKVLLAGATGYLGGYIAEELIASEYPVRLIVRDKHKVKVSSEQAEVIEAEVTRPETLKGLCDGVDVVISSVGITRQRDHLTYMDVDYQANVNLIDEAKRSGVKKFIYVSVLNGRKLRNLKMCDAKEKLVDYLIASGLDYCIIRPNGFFSDMGDFLSMAKGGRVYLFGDGHYRLNPIHGADLSKVCVNAINSQEKEINVGGPDLLTQNEIATLALKACGKKIHILHIPDSIRRASLLLLRTFTSSKTYGPLEFFLTTMMMEMEAPQYGTHHLADFFNQKTSKL
ncbi:MAG: SDR family oxidoreductase [Bacteroidaceae bacterium]|nr:SDR family oxidoreductase [Bacteroidaceae bacterium]